MINHVPAKIVKLRVSWLHLKFFTPYLYYLLSGESRLLQICFSACSVQICIRTQYQILVVLLAVRDVIVVLDRNLHSRMNKLFFFFIHINQSYMLLFSSLDQFLHFIFSCMTKMSYFHRDQSSVYTFIFSSGF